VGFTICTHTTSLSQDLTSDQEKLAKNRKKDFTGKKREETARRATKEDPSPGWTEARDVMWPEGIITELQHIQWVRQIPVVAVVVVVRSGDAVQRAKLDLGGGRGRWTQAAVCVSCGKPKSSQFIVPNLTYVLVSTQTTEPPQPKVDRFKFSSTFRTKQVQVGPSGGFQRLW